MTGDTWKTCPKCGVPYPRNSVYFAADRGRRDGLHPYCRSCNRRKLDESKERRRSEMGDDAWRGNHAEEAARSRNRTGNAAGRRYARARSRAFKRLREAHPGEYDLLLQEELLRALHTENNPAT